MRVHTIKYIEKLKYLDFVFMSNGKTGNPIKSGFCMQIES